MADAGQVEDSLKKLKTSYIDILYVHWWDYSTSVEEVMHALNDLVKSGKVMYLGVSDTPGEHPFDPLWLRVRD